MLELSQSYLSVTFMSTNLCEYILYASTETGSTLDLQDGGDDVWPYDADA